MWWILFWVLWGLAAVLAIRNGDKHIDASSGAPPPWESDEEDPKS